MVITQKISLDFCCPKIQPRVSAVQGDSYTRAVEVTLLENGAAWAVPEDASVLVRYRRPDGTGDLYDTLPDGTTAWSASDNLLTVILSPMMLAVEGLVTAQLQIIREEETLATFGFGILVERDPSAGVPESQESVGWAEWTQKEMERMITEALASGEYAGPKGEKGDSYVLTEEDKTEIAEMAAALVDTDLLGVIGTGEVTV